jgi:hypothetical protein
MPLIPLHGGPFHGIEWMLSLVLIFGPLIALGVVIAVQRGRDGREAEDTEPIGS